MRQKRLIGVVEAVNSSNETIPQPIGCAVSQKPVALASSDRLKRLEMAIETLVPSQKGFESPFFFFIRRLDIKRFISQFQLLRKMLPNRNSSDLFRLTRVLMKKEQK